jgi:carboxyl-terminal processing protease
LVRFRGQRLLRKVWILGFFLGVVGLPWVNARLVAADVVIQKGATGWGESVATREKERREFLRLGDLASSVMNFFGANHFAAREFDERLSLRLLDLYLDLLDPEHLCFTEGQVREYRERYGRQFLEDTSSGRLDAVRAISGKYRVFYRAMGECLAGWIPTLDDFPEDVSAVADRTRASWPADDAAVWRSWWEELGAELVEKRMGGMELSEAVASLDEEWRRRVSDIRADTALDRVSQFLTAFASALDSHSEYLTRDQMREEESEIRLSRIGVGISIETNAGGVRVTGVDAGGPASKTGRIRVNDRILAVGQGRQGGWVEVSGLHSSRVATLIRGDEGTFVRLRVLHASSVEDAEAEEVLLRRTKLLNDEGRAFGKVLDWASPDGESRSFGWISLSSFYGDDAEMIAKRKRSCSRDVRTLLTAMKGSGVSGIILDLRGNGGGLLDEALEIGGLFLGNRTVTVVKGLHESPQRLGPERYKASVYGGPLVVLVDRDSASASELLAGALQDHARAIVVGGLQTYGKGTVQNVVDLGDYVSKELRKSAGGALVTAGKFYRVTGFSTQLSGVRPDVVLPSTLDISGNGESGMKNPLGNDSIPRLVRIEEGVLHAVDAIRLSSLSHARVIQSAEFHEIDAQRSRLEREWRENRISVGLRTRRVIDEEKKARERAWNRWPQNPFSQIRAVAVGSTETDGGRGDAGLFRGMKGAEEFVIGLEGVRILDDLVASQPRPVVSPDKAKAQRNR